LLFRCPPRVAIVVLFGGCLPAMAEVPPRHDEAADSSDEDDDDEVELPPPPPMKKGPRQSVSAEAYGEWNRKTEFVAPVYPKTDDQMARIAGTLSNSFLFSGLDAQEMQTVTLAFKEKIVQPGERFIQQGDDGDAMYLIEVGAVDCVILFNDGLERIVKQCGPGEVVGELALLYNTTRAASVQATQLSQFWELDRDTFNRIVKDSASRRRDTYTEFLKKVPLFANLDAYEMMTIADALKAASYPDVHTMLIQQGDVGDKFFIVAEGMCEAWKVVAEGQEPQLVMQHQVGDYFGELALMSGEQTLRAASVFTSVPFTKVLYMDRNTFKRLCGTVEEVLQRQAERYN